MTLLSDRLDGKNGVLPRRSDRKGEHSHDFHLHFVGQSRSFDVDFQQQEKTTGESVTIDGRSYVLHGDESNVLWLKTKLPGLSNSGMTIEELKLRLQELGATEISCLGNLCEKVNTAATQSLGKQVSRREGSWSLQKKASLPGKQEAVANKYWEKNSARFAKIAKATKHIERLKRQKESCGSGKAGQAKRNSLITQIEIHEKRLAELRKPDGMFLQFLKNCSSSPSIVDAIFSSAVERNDPKKFQKLFSALTEGQLSAIDHGEGLNAIPPTPLSRKPVTVTKSDLRDIQDYMRDTGFSGAVTISDSTGTYTISTSNVPDPQVPFAIHSVGKVFTGVLALRLIEEGVISKKALDEPIQLSPKVIEELPSKVREQLKHITLREVMLHHGRYGDYLGNYQDAIEEAVRENILPPTVDSPEDFLRFADTELVTPDKSGYSYSNLGLLLVGLSIQHLYNSRNESANSYDELLHDYVLEPASVEVYERHKPDKARVNPQDKVSPHITGGPAGGAWSTVGDLARFGNWLGGKYRDTDSPFSELVEEFGGEFFSDKEFAHGGSIESASAHLSHRLENGVTITTVSDKEGLGLASDLAQTIQENLLEETPLERLSRESAQGVLPSIAQTRAFQSSSLPDSVLFYLLQLETSPAFSGVAKIAYGDEEPITIVSSGSPDVAPEFDAETPFNIMSVGKTFTAIAIQQLAEQGLVDLDLPLSESSYLLETDYMLEGSDFQYQKDMCPTKSDEKAVAEAVEFFKSSSKVTLRQLLSHTSGLYQTPNGLRFDSEATGERWNYSNYGYQLLARVVRNQSDSTSFVEYVQKNIFSNPRDPRDVIMPGALACSKNSPQSEPEPQIFFMGQLTSKGLPEEASRVPSPDGNGCWFMTAQDLIQFAQAFSENKFFRTPGLAKSMITPVARMNPKDSFVQQGLGFVISPDDEHSAFFHQGRYHGRSAVVCQVEGKKRLTFTGLCNSNEAGDFWAGIVMIMRGESIPEPLDYTRELAEQSKATYAWLDELSEPYDEISIKEYLDKVDPPFLPFNELPMLAAAFLEAKPALSLALENVLAEMRR